MQGTSDSSSAEARITVFGLGYVGCVTAACLAQLGHRVLGVDRDERKVRNVLDGRAPFYEPGLEELVRNNVAAGRLAATTAVKGQLGEADVVLICVGTPSERNGNLQLEQLSRVSSEIGQELANEAGADAGLIVAVRSTVFPGTCEEVVMPALAGSRATVVSNPEFLREGSAVSDFMQPSLVVVGACDEEARQRVADLYAPLAVEPCLVSLRTAEMIKYACNSFHALKIAFANEMGVLSAGMGISPREVMETLCRDVKLNISPAYLRPGFAFGGSCLPKDLRALVYRVKQMDMRLPLMDSVLPSNEQHLSRAIRSVLDVPSQRLGIFGLAFKENTDDLRESPVVTLIEQLLGKGRQVRIFDPHIQLDRIYGTNREFLQAALPHIAKFLDSSLEQLLGWAHHIVLAQKPDKKMAETIRKSQLPILDLVGSNLFPSSTR